MKPVDEVVPMVITPVAAPGVILRAPEPERRVRAEAPVREPMVTEEVPLPLPMPIVTSLAVLPATEPPPMLIV